MSNVIALTSPYRRTRETADWITQGSAIPFMVDERCREWGKTCTVNGKTYPEEKLLQALLRLDIFLKLLLPTRRYLIVSHATPIYLMMKLMSMPSSSFVLATCVGPFWSPIKNCGITHVKDRKVICVSTQL